VWLLLCTADDHPALWAAGRLRARGLDPLVVLTPELLHHSFRWQHRLGNDNAPSVAFTLADGRRIRGEAIRGVLNRLTGLPPHLVEALPPADRTYALQEWAALHVSWLSSLEAPVLNLPVVHGLGGALRSEAEWVCLAAGAGLPTLPFRRSTERRATAELLPSQCGAELQRRAEGDARPPGARTICVVDGAAIDGALPPDLKAGCARLGGLAGTRLIGVTLDVLNGTFLTASPRPDLRIGGEALIDALCTALTSRG
jgi:hypothetical protein